MFSFFKLLDNFNLLLSAKLSITVIAVIVKKLTRQETLMKIYDLFNYFRSLLFVYRKIAPKDRMELLFL